MIILTSLRNCLLLQTWKQINYSWDCINILTKLINKLILFITCIKYWVFSKKTIKSKLSFSESGKKMFSNWFNSIFTHFSLAAKRCKFMMLIFYVSCSDRIWGLDEEVIFFYKKIYCFLSYSRTNARCIRQSRNLIMDWQPTVK